MDQNGGGQAEPEEDKSGEATELDSKKTHILTETS